MAGDGLVLASLLLGAAATVAQGRLLTGRDPVAVTAVQFLGAAVGALLVTVFTEGAPAVPGSPGPVLAVLALTVGGTVLPFTLFAFGQSRVSAEVAGAFLNLEPLVGAIAGAAAFGDPVGLVQVAGGAAIVAGIGLSSLPLLAGRRPSQAAPLALVPAGAEPLALAPAGAEPLTLAPAGAEPLTLAPAGARPALAGAELAGAGLADAELAARESGTLPDRTTRAPLSLNSGVRRGGRNGVFVVVHGGKFGARRPGGTRPTPGRAGTRRRESARPAGSRPGGRAAERPPGRGWTAERPPGQGRAAERPPGRGWTAERSPGQGRAAERPAARGQGRGGRGALELVQVRASSGR